METGDSGVKGEQPRYPGTSSCRSHKASVDVIPKWIPLTHHGYSPSQHFSSDFAKGKVALFICSSLLCCKKMTFLSFVVKRRKSFKFRGNERHRKGKKQSRTLLVFNEPTHLTIWSLLLWRNPRLFPWLLLGLFKNRLHFCLATQL